MIYNNIQYDDKKFYRVFNENVNSDELIWHRDKKDRCVRVVSVGKNWKFQMEDTFPIEINKGDEILIPKMTFHRLIKGNNKLILSIIESD